MTKAQSAQEHCHTTLFVQCHNSSKPCALRLQISFRRGNRHLTASTGPAGGVSAHTHSGERGGMGGGGGGDKKKQPTTMTPKQKKKYKKNF